MKVYKYSPRSFERAVESGIFGDTKVELLGGLPHVMTTNPPHVFAVRRLASMFPSAFPPDAFAVNEEKFVASGTWRPQPDAAVVRHAANAYLPRLADPDGIELIVDVSDTSYPIDRGRKWRKYAAAGINTYWIANLNDRIVQVCTIPQGTRYLSSETFKDGELVLGLAVADMLPPP